MVTTLDQTSLAGVKGLAVPNIIQEAESSLLNGKVVQKSKNSVSRQGNRIGQIALGLIGILALSMTALLIAGAAGGFSFRVIPLIGAPLDSASPLTLLCVSVSGVVLASGCFMGVYALRNANTQAALKNILENKEFVIEFYKEEHLKTEEQFEKLKAVYLKECKEKLIRIKDIHGKIEEMPFRKYKNIMLNTIAMKTKEIAVLEARNKELLNVLKEREKV